ncbi:hypothetical protein [Microcoleus sp.]|uniref:hypothetical protein n=1 Tax=Microcoleus sp. TaxID=44472 RepID=UPI003593717A
MKTDFVTDFTDVRKFGNGLCSGFKGCNGLMLREEGSSANEQCPGFNGFKGGILREEVRI